MNACMANISSESGITIGGLAFVSKMLRERGRALSSVVGVTYGLDAVLDPVVGEVFAETALMKSSLLGRNFCFKFCRLQVFCTIGRITVGGYHP